MADITKCSAEKCHLADTCWRKQAPSNEYHQAWQDFSFGLDNPFCDFYIERSEQKFLDPKKVTFVK